jgi:hypothetical protein
MGYQQGGKPSIQALMGALLRNELSSDEFQLWFNQLNTQEKLALLDQLDSRVSHDPAPNGTRR